MQFEGDFNPDPRVSAFEGDYDFVLGGLSRESTLWDAPDLYLVLIDTDTPEIPESYQATYMKVTDHIEPSLEIVPGQTVDVPVRRCLGQLNLSFVSTATDFYKPVISGSGSFSGLDFESRPASYQVSLQEGHGTPRTYATAAGQGLVVTCLPEGRYDLYPEVTSIDPGGGTSQTGLPPVLGVEVGCRQVKDVTLGLQVNLDPLPACTTEAEPTLTGSADATGGVSVSVAEIFATVNDGPPISICTDCGEDPSFTHPVALAQCDNEIKVTAEADLGPVSATTASIRFDDIEPAIEGCTDIAVDNDPGQAGAVVSFAAAAADNCDGSRPVTCEPPSGSFFEQGATAVTCTSSDTCGNEASCSFTVSVCQPVEPDVRTQGFWKRQCQGSHPSGEPDNLPGYVDLVNDYQTFAGVGDVPALCDRLNPQPRNNRCEKAEAQLMAAALNVASGRVAACNCANDPDHAGGTVGEVLADLDARLANPARSSADCGLVQAVADRLNRGESDCGGDSGDDGDSDSDSDSDDADSDSDD